MKKKIALNVDLETRRSIFGPNDSHLKLLELHYKIEINPSETELSINYRDEKTFQKVELIFLTINKLITLNYNIDERLFTQVINLADNNQLEHFFNLHSLVVGRTKNGRSITPKTLGQLNYVEALKKYDIVFAVGPAGTGKTYLAVVDAVTQLKEGKVKKIILTRPAVEAGESLGYLPGDLKEKIDPYLRPLYDALYEMLGPENCERMLEKGLIEVAPLAYMRGRTLEDAYIILDEAQNTTLSQLKMFLTRLGFNSRMVITGDITQIDLRGSQSGLLKVQDILGTIKNIDFIILSSKDVSRHPLVQAIIEAFEKAGY
ncbi:MAG: PhoH family protein [Bacilli bacterium]|jgi:phosphate starvation-inducible PhoH-like protein